MAARWDEEDSMDEMEVGGVEVETEEISTKKGKGKGKGKGKAKEISKEVKRRSSKACK